MAAERCANPAYLSDVNRMMLEYALHKTIKAHIELFHHLTLSDDPDMKNTAALSILQTSPASTLTEVYDTLITLIRASKAPIPDEQIFRIDTSLLQLLVLLRTWIAGRFEARGNPNPDFSAEMYDNLRRDRIVNQTYRRLWQHYRSYPNTVPDTHSTSAWTPHQHGQPIHFADHIVPRFMEISELLFSIFHGLSEKWMHLATTLFTQSAIELFSYLYEDDLHDPKKALESCFAWGYVERSWFAASFETVVAPQLHANSEYRNLDADMQNHLMQNASRKAETEDRLWEMFFNQASDSNPSQSSAISTHNVNNANAEAKSTDRRTPQSSGELKTWTEVRRNVLDDVLLTYTSILEAGKEHMDRPLQMLKDQYPLNDLLAQLTDFIEKHWKILHARKDLPVLLQIEEGRLDGLDAEEFERFKQRTGIAGLP